MNHQKLSDVAERYLLGDVVDARTPGTRLHNILDRLHTGRPMTTIALDYLNKRGHTSLVRLARSEITYEEFCVSARAEQPIRAAAAEAAKLAKREAEKLREAELEAASQRHFVQAEKDRIARENDPRYIKKMRDQRLRKQYGITWFVDESCFGRIMEILRRVDGGNRFSDDDVLWLETEGKAHYSDMLRSLYHEREAEFCAAEYKRTSDPWQVVNASGHYRKCEKAEAAVQLVSSTSIDRLTSPKLRSALYTTHGGALRDLGRRDEAMELGNRAHGLAPRDFRPCTLLGAVHMEAGNFEIARDWYAKAIERGATEHSIDSDLRSIYMRSDKAKREQIKAFLLREDPVRYGWVNNPQAHPLSRRH